MHTIEALVELSQRCSVELDGAYRPARPIPFNSLLLRVHDAWEVMMGRADAVIWPEDYPKKS